MSSETLGRVYLHAMDEYIDKFNDSYILAIFYLTIFVEITNIFFIFVIIKK